VANFGNPFGRIASWQGVGTTRMEGEENIALVGVPESEVLYLTSCRSKRNTAQIAVVESPQQHKPI
jgi:hypothetical protein